MPAAPRQLAPPLTAAAIGGAFYFLAFVGFGFWPLLAVFLVPLWWALERVRTRGPAATFAVGGTFGAVAYAGGHPWLLDLVDVFLAGNATLGVALWLLYGLWFAAGFALYALATRALHRRGVGPFTAWVAPWLVLERTLPLVFPVHAGSALVDVEPLVQLVDLGGPLLASALVCTVDLAIYRVLMAWPAGGPVPGRELAIAVALFAAAIGYGEWRIHTLAQRIAEAPALEVGVVQANLGLLEKRSAAERGHRAHVEQTRELLAGGAVDLVVWPETAYARALRGPLPLAADLVRSGLEVPLLFGGTLVDASGPRPTQSNAALLVEGDGMIRTAYRKNLLIPLAESIPLEPLWPGLAERLPHAQGFVAATDRPALRLGDWRISVPICYEAVRPSFVRRMVRDADANLLVTIANDAWFGRSREPWIHLQLARMRAIEHRRYLVRATNSGISAVVDPLGRLRARTGLLERANLRATVRRLETRTLYARIGDWPGAVAIAWLAVAITRPRTASAPRA